MYNSYLYTYAANISHAMLPCWCQVTARCASTDAALPWPMGFTRENQGKSKLNNIAPLCDTRWVVLTTSIPSIYTYIMYYYIMIICEYMRFSWIPDMFSAFNYLMEMRTGLRWGLGPWRLKFHSGRFFWSWKQLRISAEPGSAKEQVIENWTSKCNVVMSPSLSLFLHGQIF